MHACMHSCAREIGRKQSITHLFNQKEGKKSLSTQQQEAQVNLLTHLWVVCFISSTVEATSDALYSSSMEAFLLDLPWCFAGGEGENSHGTAGSSISPLRILTTSPPSGRSSGILCKHKRARLMQRLACSLSYASVNLSSTSSRRLPV